METVEETIDLGVPVRTAYDQWTQFESFPEFMSGVESVTQLTDTTNQWVTKIAGVESEFDTKIVNSSPTNGSPGAAPTGNLTPDWCPSPRWIPATAGFRSDLNGGRKPSPKTPGPP